MAVTIPSRLIGREGESPFRLRSIGRPSGVVRRCRVVIGPDGSQSETGLAPPSRSSIDESSSSFQWELIEMKKQKQKKNEQQNSKSHSISTKLGKTQ